MSPSVIEDEVVEQEVDEVETEEVEEESTDTIPAKRKHLSKDNKYIFTDKDTAKEALDSSSLKYKDGSSVEKFRVWSLIKDLVRDDDGKRTSGNERAFVLARSQHQASDIYMESLGVTSTLTFPKGKGGAGRSKSKVTKDILDFGKLLASLLFEAGLPSNAFLATATPAHKTSWAEMFESADQYAHYLNEDKTWKEPN